MNPIPVTDLGYLHREQAAELEEAALRVLRAGRYLRGAEVEAFEREFADHCGSRAAVAVGSGLDALRLSLIALGIGRGDEVIVSAHTAVATWLAVSHTGARVVPVDADEATMLVDPDSIGAAVGPRTAAIVVVHLYGLVAEMEPIGQLASKRGLHSSRMPRRPTALGTATVASAQSATWRVQSVPNEEPRRCR